MLVRIAAFLDSFRIGKIELYDYLDWIYSESGGYESYLQYLILHYLGSINVEVSIKGKMAHGDCDFFLEGEGIELKIPRKGWENLYKKAFEGHPNADSYLFVHEGKKYYEEACHKAEEHHTIPLAGDDWWLTWMKLDKKSS